MGRYEGKIAIMGLLANHRAEKTKASVNNKMSSFRPLDSAKNFTSETYTGTDRLFH